MQALILILLITFCSNVVSNEVYSPPPLYAVEGPSVPRKNFSFGNFIVKTSNPLVAAAVLIKVAYDWVFAKEAKKPEPMLPPVDPYQWMDGEVNTISQLPAIREMYDPNYVAPRFPFGPVI